MPLAPTTMPTSTWDEFANNLATDLAPILQLFGEQVTKQYLAESTSVWDCIIFAMAPLGVLTAVVSVIRVCGGSQLKAFIGRSQEGSGVAEVELCSSTGRDVAELYQKGAIARVFGRAKILEVVHDRQEEEKTQDTLGLTHMGLFSLEEHQSSQREFPKWISSKNSSKITSSELSANPSLRLNIGFRQPSRMILLCCVAFSSMLQASMLGFATWITSVRKLPLQSGPVSPWALPMVITGTCILCSGMFMCSFLIEQSTAEYTHKRRKVPKSTFIEVVDEQSSAVTASVQDMDMVYMIQPGGQVIGDQTFDSFGYSDERKPLRKYTTSIRSQASPRLRAATWAASITTVTGFIVQFVGLRSVHPAVSLYQLASVLVMCVIRASMRTQRLDANDDIFHKAGFGRRRAFHSPFNGSDNSPPETRTAPSIASHELDWLALEVFQKRHGSAESCRCDNLGAFWSLKWNETTTGAAEVEEQCAEKKWSRLNDEALLWTALRGRDFGDAAYSFSRADTIWRYRVRLAELTSSEHAYRYPRSWPAELVHGRTCAMSAAQVISVAVCTLVQNSRKVRSFNQTLVFRFECASNDTRASKPKQSIYGARDQLFMYLHRTPAETWQLGCEQVEAVIALTGLSYLTGYFANGCDRPFGSEQLYRIVGYGRIRSWTQIHSTWACLTYETYSKWVQELQLQELEIDLGSGDCSSESLWCQTGPDSTYSALSGDMDIRRGDRSCARFFGWAALACLKKEGRTKLLVYPVKHGIATMVAQDLFIAFLYSLLQSSETPLGISDYDPVFEKACVVIQNKTIDNLVDAFQLHDLGSRMDKNMCIVPIIEASRWETPISQAIDIQLTYMEEGLADRRFVNFGRILTWLDSRTLNSINSTQIWRVLLIASWWKRLDTANANPFAAAKNPLRLRLAEIGNSSCVGLSKSSLITMDCLNNLRTRMRSAPWYDRGWSRSDYNGAEALDLLHEADTYGVLLCLADILHGPDEDKGHFLLTLIQRDEPELLLVLDEIIQRCAYSEYCTYRDPDGRGALSLACSQAPLAVVIKLLDWCPRVSSKWGFVSEQITHETDDRGWTAFHHVVANDRLDILQAGEFDADQWLIAACNNKTSNPKQLLLALDAADRTDIMLEQLFTHNEPDISMIWERTLSLELDAENIVSGETTSSSIDDALHTPDEIAEAEAILRVCVRAREVKLSLVPPEDPGSNRLS